MFWRNAEVACMLYFCLFYFLRYQMCSGVFSQCIVRVGKGARFHARVFPIIFMDADMSHIFRGVSEKKIETVQRGIDTLL